MATPKLSVSLIAVGIAGVVLIALSAFITNSAEDAIKKSSKAETKKEQTSSPDVDPPKKTLDYIRAKVGSEKFMLNLDLGDAAQEFAAAVPFDLDMKDKDGVEKYFCGEDKLPTTDAYQPGHIAAGDVMLYQDNCIVIFYKDVDNDYSYVKLGRINDTDRLLTVFDDGKDVNVTFFKQ